MPRNRRNIPVNKIADRSKTGIFFKHTSDWGNGAALDFPHRDDYYMLSILLEGDVKVAVDFKSLTLRSGEGLILVPGQVHLPQTKDMPPDGWSLFVSPDHIEETDRHLLERYAFAPVPLKFTEEMSSDIARLFGMLRRYEYDGGFSRAAVTAIVKLFCRSVTIPGEIECDRFTILTLRLKSLLGKNLSAGKGPGAYASMLNISGVYLNEAVKSVTGMSAGEFIRSQILLNAKRQLAHTSLTVGEVAAALGYDDCSYFSRLFKKETGLTPSEFRKNLG